MLAIKHLILKILTQLWSFCKILLRDHIWPMSLEFHISVLGDGAAELWDVTYEMTKLWTYGCMSAQVLASPLCKSVFYLPLCQSLLTITLISGREVPVICFCQQDLFFVVIHVLEGGFEMKGSSYSGINPSPCLSSLALFHSSFFFTFLSPLPWPRGSPQNKCFPSFLLFFFSLVSLHFLSSQVQIKIKAKPRYWVTHLNNGCF